MAKIKDLPAGTVVHQDEDGYYFVLPDGTTRRTSVVISEAGASVVQTDITKDASVEVSVRDIRGERVGGEPETRSSTSSPVLPVPS